VRKTLQIVLPLAKYKLHWTEWLIVAAAVTTLFAMMWHAITFPGL